MRRVHDEGGSRGTLTDIIPGNRLLASRTGTVFPTVNPANDDRAVAIIVLAISLRERLAKLLVYIEWYMGALPPTPVV